MSRGKRFTEQELEYIKVHAQDMTISEIATALGRNYWSIQRIMQSRTAELLTAEQKRKINILKEDMSIYQIAHKLCISYSAVNGYLSKRVNVKQNHIFSKADDDIIRQMYPQYRIRFIATRLGLNEEQVYNRAKRLGLRKNRKTTM